MKTKLTNIYTNESFSNVNLKGDHGQAFYLEVGEQKVLFDTGTKADILLHNMKVLGISASDVNKIIFSHGHFDHTGGLPGFLDSINPTTPIPIFGHPLIMENKVFRLKKGVTFVQRDIGFPKLTRQQLEKVDFQLSKNPIEIVPGVSTTGEISTRIYKDGKEPNALHEVNGNLEVDPVFDDQSIVINSKDGLVIVTGCCHAGVLNTLEHIVKMDKKPIKAVIGGTHMVRFSEKEVMEVADILEDKFGTPNLYLNHCTDNLPKPLSLVVKMTQASKLLKNRFNERKVKICDVGTKFEFEI